MAEKKVYSRGNKVYIAAVREKFAVAARFAIEATKCAANAAPFIILASNLTDVV